MYNNSDIIVPYKSKIIGFYFSIFSYIQISKKKITKQYRIILKLSSLDSFYCLQNVFFL